MKSIAAILPKLGQGSGGLRTVLNLLAGLTRHGCECHVYVEGDAPEQQLKESLRKYYDCDWVIPHNGWKVEKGHDLVIATMWHTALALAGMPGNFRRAYLVQDYEPFFYPMGSHHLLAEFSYEQNLQVITMGRWLAEKLRADFGLIARPLDFCADQNIYRPRAEGIAPELAIAAIWQPEKPHRAPQACAEALLLLKRTLPALKIYTFGSPRVPAALKSTHLGIISPARLGDIYSRCLAGLCVSMTNPSRVPFEMLAAGLPVVEAHRGNNLLDLPSNGVLLADLDPRAIKDALLDLIADGGLRERERRAGLEFMAKRPAQLEQEQFCEHIFDILAGRTAKKQTAPTVKREPHRRIGWSSSFSLPGDTLKRELQPPDFDLLTVDIWDTLLRRKCHPDEIKLYTARYLQLSHWSSLKPVYANPLLLVKERIHCEQGIGSQRRAQGLDDEYPIKEVFQAWIASAFAVLPSGERLEKIADDLVAAEVAQERRVIYADPEIKAFLDRIPAARRLFLSDFYMPAPHLKGLLSDAGLDSIVSDGIVSCDVSLNKRSGRLFRKVQQDLGVASARHAHVGDNEFSDYFIPRTLGMTGFHFVPSSEQEKCERFQREFAIRTEALTETPAKPKPKLKRKAHEKPEKEREPEPKASFCPEELHAATSLCNEDLDSLNEAQAMQRYGETMAPLFVNFALFIAEEAIKAGLPKVYFCTREGEFFARVYSAVAKSNPLGVPFPEPVILEVSRLATFAASLNRFDLPEFMRLWNLYSSQSLRSFFVSLDLDPAPVASLIEAQGLKLEEVLSGPWLDARVKKLFATERFVKFLSDATAQKRALLLDYLKSKGIQGTEAKLGLVDIGWRGTIHDNLAWVLPKTTIHGWYLGLLPFLNVQPPNVMKSAFGPGRAGDLPRVLRLLEYVSPIEMLCNSESGSALRYERREAGVFACREINQHEEEVFRRFTSHFQTGVLNQVNPIADLVRERAIGSMELRPLSIELLSRIIHDPPQVIAEAYFHLNHNETFGAGAFDDKQRHRARIQHTRNLYEAGAMEDFERELRDTTWPQGFGRLCGIEYPFFNRDNRRPRALSVERRRAARLAGAEALQCYRERRLDEASRAGLRALALDPWRVSLHYLLYRICIDQNRTKEALHRFTLIRILNPRHGPSYNEFACRAFESGLALNGVKILEDLVEEQPDYSPAIMNLCRAHLRQGKFLKALAVLDDGVKACGDNPEFLRFRSMVQFFAGHAVLAESGDLFNRLPKGLAQGAPWLGQLQNELRGSELLRPGNTTLSAELKKFARLASDDECLGIRGSVLKTDSANAIGAECEAAASDVKVVATVPPLASIILLAHNQLDHTRLCIQSLLMHTRKPFEVILVDNGSTDGTAEYFAALRREHGCFKVITNRTNRGFAAGNNQGLAIAQGEIVVLLNNDTVVTVEWLERMTDVLRRHPKAGVVGPMSNHVSGPQLAADVPYRNLADLPAFAAEWSRTRHGQSFEINRAVGFCLLATRAVLERIGGLDEQFGSGNFEDDDFCIRARFAGFQIRIAQDVFIHHTGSQTFKGARIDYRQAMLRNWELFRAKWQLPSDVALERGYPMPASLPETVVIKVALPALNLTHKAEQETHWNEAAIPAERIQAKAPEVSRLGNLDEARAQMGRAELPAAWSAGLEALRIRPFHPEAWLLLAEIALAAGAAAEARQCAQVARDLAPGWKSPKQFLQKSLKGDAHPDWLKLPLHGQPASRLTVCVITRNEEQFLDQCLRSVKGLADQIVVVDTGSTDRTIQIAESHGAEVHHFTWCDDFSAARNAALEQVTGDWVLMLDADEELPDAQHAQLRADLNQSEALAYRLPLVNRGDEAHGRSYVPRLYRNVPGTYYYGRIHEQVFPSLVPHCKVWGMDTRLGTAEILHHGYTKEMVKDRNKVERNLNLLRMAVQERPDDANLVMNLGLELVRSGDLANGLTHYREAFRLMSAQPPVEVVPELREVLLTQFASHLYKVRAHEEVAQVLTSPLAKNGGLTASLHFALGLSQFELKKYRDAAEHMRQCLSRRKQATLAPINTDILTAAPQHCLALSLAKIGDAAGAEKAFQAGLGEIGRTEDLQVDYARWLAAEERPVEALHQLNGIVQKNLQHAIAWRQGGEIALSRPDFLEFARDWTSEAIRALPDDAVVVAQRAEALLLSQEIAQALPLWERPGNGERQPRAVAAQIICATVESQPIHGPQNNAEEIATSRAFVDWYRRLIAAGAKDTIMVLNARVDALRSTLPSAATLLDAVMAEAGRAEAAAR